MSETSGEQESSARVPPDRHAGNITHRRRRANDARIVREDEANSLGVMECWPTAVHCFDDIRPSYGNGRILRCLDRLSLPTVVAITCGAEHRQVHRLVGQHSRRGVWRRYASL